MPTHIRVGLTYSHRLQILLHESQYRLLTSRAEQEHCSLARLVRRAIDRTYGGREGRRRAAWEEIKAMEPIELPETIEELEAEIQGRWGGKSEEDSRSGLITGDACKPGCECRTTYTYLHMLM